MCPLFAVVVVAVVAVVVVAPSLVVGV